MSQNIDYQTNIVYNTLVEASSQDINILKPAEQKLKEWETQPGYYTTLFNVFATRELNVRVRWLAIVCIKNGVEKYWRPNAPNAISEDEKAYLRQCLTKCFDEPVNPIALQIALIIAKIARIDYPTDWPQMLDILMNSSKCEESVVRSRALLYLYHVVKMLASKKLPRDRRVFNELSANIYPFILDYWKNSMSVLLTVVSSGAGADDTQFLNAVCAATLNSKILKQLTLFGFVKPDSSIHVKEFLLLIFQQTKLLLQCRLTVNGNCLEVLEKHITLLVKTLFHMLENFPLSYVEFIPLTLESGYYFAFTEDGTRLVYKRILIIWINMVKLILTGFGDYENKKDDESNPVRGIKKFFTPQIVTDMCMKLIEKYLVLTEDELISWDTNPEAYVSDEGCESWRYDLRPCAESLFLALVRQCRETVIPLLVNIVKENRRKLNPSDWAAILRKDAIYNAFGAAIFDLFDEIDFDSLFLDTLIPELREKSSNYRIIRRRIAWLIGQWSGLKFSINLRPLLYEELLKLLDDSEDTVIRMTAAHSLKNLVDDFDFDSEVFATYIPECVQRLFKLLQDVRECDTKMRVLSILCFIVERVGWSLTPYFNSLITYLPLLWDQSAEHNMLRCAIVSTLTQIVKGMRSRCYTVGEFVRGAVSYSLDLEQDGHVYLKEDGLLLLQAYVENIESGVDSNILQVYSYVLPHIEVSTENLNLVCAVTKAYLLYSPEEFLRTYGERFVSACTEWLMDLKSEDLVVILMILELFLEVDMLYSMQLMENTFEKIVLNICRSEEKPTAASVSLCIISRLITYSTDLFAQLMMRISEKTKTPFDALLEKFLEIWLKKVSCVSALHRRKKLGFALMILLSVNSKPILNQCSSILAAITSIISDVTVEENGICYDNLMNEGEDEEGEEMELYKRNVEGSTEHEIRLAELESKDFIYDVDILEAFRHYVLTVLKDKVDSAHFQQLLNSVDSETAECIKVYSRNYPSVSQKMYTEC